MQSKPASMETKGKFLVSSQRDGEDASGGIGGTGGGSGGSSSSPMSTLKPKRVRRSSKPTRPPPFLTKTFKMVGDQETNSIISWSSSGTTFTVWDPDTFAEDLLPKHFKHNNFTSFIAQLNLYSFRKISWDRWEYGNEWFREGKEELLMNMRRRTEKQQCATKSCPGLVKIGRETKEEKLMKYQKHLKHAFVKLERRQELEIQKLQDKQKGMENCLTTLEKYIEISLSKQQRRLNIMANAFASIFSQMRQKRKLDDAESSERQEMVEANDARDADRKNDKENNQLELTLGTHLQYFNSTYFRLLEKLMDDDLIVERSNWGAQVRELLEETAHQESKP